MAEAVQVAFPEATRALLEALNQQRVEGQLCDLAIHVQGRVFRAHRAVLAACSPYFHDQVLLKNMSSVVLPSVMDPAAFELVLGSAYTGRLRMGRDDLVNFLTVGSVLQMWHIVDKCTELLKERQRRPELLAQDAAASSSSSSTSGCCSGGRAGGGGESQSPSSSSYFSPRREGPIEQPRAGLRVGGGGGGGGDRGREEEEEALLLRRPAPRRLRPPEDPFPRRAAAEPDDDGEPGSSEARRPAYARPSLVPQRPWVPVKKERGVGRASGGEALAGLVLTCEEEEEDDEEEEEEEEEPADPAALSISDVRTLSEAAPAPPPPLPEEQVNFCESSQDVAFPPSATSVPRALLPLDLPAGPLLLFPASGASVGPAPGVGPAEHGAVQLPGASGEANKIFLCHCGKAFSHKSMRDRHVNMHLNLRPFDCPVCNKKFKMKHHLTEHMKTHTGLKPYQCLVCAKKFMWRDSFMRHKGHCERRHRLGPTAGTLSDAGNPRKEASPPRLPGEAEWAAGRSPRSDGGLASTSGKM
ncbi:zinc finger and BTB domain-containing protein 22 [Pseudonaja textilis]|uniref:Zinc finger and BTB domain containing 22 n=1 Tax=Pseudonaja textilis TaxID=8673 RepID=A0A670Z6C2_PSETE|nr:zinc finger and BTB domain-containing protein 22 [Pseudonaja textilis]